MRLLLVEDDDAIAQALVERLGGEGHAVERVCTAVGALAAEPADMVLLDLGLPDQDGGELVGQLRGASRVPIVVVTARGDESDKVSALEIGADDYVVKPFGFKELLARINAVARRAGLQAAAPEGVQRIGSFEIDRRCHEVRVADAVIECTPKEYGIIEHLARDSGALVTRQQLLDGVWGPHWFGSTKMIDVHVASLRRKVGDAIRIDTVRGVGFKLVGTE